MGIIKTYEKDSRAALSDHFKVREFACRGRGCCDTVQIDEDLVAYLERIRGYFGKPVRINSGYRCQVHNEKIGGAIGSRHTKGQAADIAVDDVPPAEVAKFAESMGILGIGLYETDADGYFVHIDTRKNRAFWYGQGEAGRETFGGYGYSAFVRDLQQAIGVRVDGKAGPQTLAAAPTLGAAWNQRHAAVRPVQMYLQTLGYGEVGPADGVAGKKFAAAVAHYQRDRGLPDLGSLEQWGRTWQTMLGMAGGENNE